jgi:hypothetical protein
VSAISLTNDTKAVRPTKHGDINIHVDKIFTADEIRTFPDSIGMMKGLHRENGSLVFTIRH